MLKRSVLPLAAVVAIVALLSAVIGTAYAASSPGQATISKHKKVKRGPRGKRGPTGPQGTKGDTGPQGPKGDTGPSASFQDARDTPLTIPEPGGGLGTPINSLTLDGPATYLIQASGFVSRLGLSAGQGASHQVQLRRNGDLLLALTATAVQGSTGSATVPYSIVRLVKVSGPSQTIITDGFDQTAAGTSSTATGTMTATLVGSATGAS
jgi:hypothetical protein